MSNNKMKMKIIYIVLFIIGILIAEVPLMDFIGYIMLSIVQTNFKCLLDTMIFISGFMISFDSLKCLDEIKNK